MAIRWTVAEACEALKKGDKEAREDIGRRFPLFATASPEEILGAIHNMTARQVEARLRGEDEEEEEAPKAKVSRSDKKEKKAKKDKTSKRPKAAKLEDEDEDDDDFLDEFLDDDDE